MSVNIPDDLHAEIEGHAAELAQSAGEILSRHFGRPLRVDYKDEAMLDPVTGVDREVQRFLIGEIGRRFPGHAVLGEEDEGAACEDTPLPDFVWALDPLDGTRNFVAGLPVYASSIGVLHRGVPVVGAVYVPWPGGDGEVVHARSGGPALLRGAGPVSVRGLDGRGIVGLPAGFFFSYRLRRSSGRGLGEPRVTGSIAHELAMTAKGVFEYALVSRPHLWDVAAGVVLVKAAGGDVMSARRRGGVGGLLSARISWEPLDAVIDDWGSRSIGDLRRWRETLILGSPSSVGFLAENLRTRRRRRR